MRPASPVARLLTALALALHCLGVALPVADSLLFHEDAAAERIHMEAAGADCHHAECVLGQSLVGPAHPYHDPAVIAAQLDVARSARAHEAPTLPRRLAGIPLGSRAPPRTT